MKLKTSFFNEGFLLNDFRKYSWVAVFYTLALAFVIPINIIMILSNEYINKSALKDLFLLNNQEIQSILILSVPVVLAMLIFRYLQVQISADSLHSLPVPRSIIYRSHILVGVVLLILPVLITGIIAITLNLLLDLGNYYSIYDVFSWMGITTLMNLTIFLTCVFVGMLVGISAVQGVLTYILLAFPAGITILLTSNLDFFVYGFKFNLDYQLERLSPIPRVLHGFNPLNERQMGGGEIVVYLVICLALLFLAEYLYKLRNLENANQSIAFAKLHNIFKYGVTFCTMLLGGLYFKETQQTTAWVVFGYLIGSLTGYVVAEIMLKKSLGFFREVKNFKGYAVFGAIMLVLILGIRFDLTGYEKRLPPLAEVQQVYFSDSFYYYTNLEKYQMGFFSEPNNVQNIYQLHQKLVQDKNSNYLTKSQKPKRSAILIYQLSDGSTMTRGYEITYDEYARYLKPIYEAKEYKQAHYDVLQVNPADVEKITLRPNMRTDTYKEAVILNPVEIKEAIEVMQQDVLNKTYEQMTEQKVPWANVSMLIANNKLNNYPRLAEIVQQHNGDQQINATWSKSDALLEKWLKEKGYYQKARILPEEIAYVVVEKIESREQWEEKRKTGYVMETGNSNANNIERFEIRDKSQIETCLREYRDQWFLDDFFSQNTEGYIIGFYGGDKRNFAYGSFAAHNVPDFIKEHFKD
ncbi:hypothetical protein SPSYN_01157 [Sporotomaculum syntrophicum]|uniref:DUF6449 domain-containing protein n=1 Tax=Sporotomaculum syntrophicum TaxID=182264 RepID=A0A9D2WQE7_9FIRM|nr:DUF6449 domain-containing protein [Sporotomaculum syntrophicum]KAF1085021.1 hypothetical protein SPSYN_01157 [Sporotomaculum syntrophicum]